MNEPPFDPADEALLEQAVRGMRDDLPDDMRMQQLERRLAPVLTPDTRADRSWHGRHLPLIAGAAVVIVGVVAGTHHRMNLASSSPASVPIEAVTTMTSTPQATRPSPTVAVEHGETSSTAMPVLTVDALPSAASPRKPSSSERSTKRPSEARSELNPTPEEAAEDPGDELAVLEEARAALATDPARTLALADAHTKRFQRPAFAQERERLAIDALVRSGRRDDAQERATRFEATYPRSPHLARVRALVAPSEKVP